MAHKKIKKAVFPVGGLGTRFLPATKSMPKEMLPIASKPMIQHAFEEATQAGIEQFIFITGRNKNAINNHFDNSYELERTLSDKEKRDAILQTSGWLPTAGNIAFVRQQEPLGLGHAVWCARHFIGDEPFAVLLADEVYQDKGFLKQMVQLHEDNSHNIIAVTDVPPEHSNRYGMLDIAKDHGHYVEIKGMVEKPLPAESPSSTAIIGRYILHPHIFDFLADGTKGAGGEIQLTDAMARMVAEQPFSGLRFTGKRFDCGNQLGFLEANIAFAMAENPKAVKAMLLHYTHETV